MRSERVLIIWVWVYAQATAQRDTKKNPYFSFAQQLDAVQFGAENRELLVQNVHGCVAGYVMAEGEETAHNRRRSIGSSFSVPCDGREQKNDLY